MFAEDILENGVALVTGAGRGIGKEIALTCADLGADVAVNDLYEEPAADTVDAIEERGQNAVAVPGDVSDPNVVEAMFDAAADELGTVHHVVNNAGANSDADLVDISIEEWEKVVDINLNGTFLVAREGARRLRAAGEPGSMVNIASIAGTMPQPGAGAYTPTKGAIIKLTQQMALEWAMDDIRVNALCPGLIWTPATDSVYSDDELLERRKEWVPIQRIGAPDDVARAVMYLLAPENKYTTGESLYVDGGAQCVGLNLIPGRAQHE